MLSRKRAIAVLACALDAPALIAASRPSVVTMYRLSGALWLSTTIDGAEDRRMVTADAVVVPDNVTAETAPAASALVAYPDGTKVRIEPNTRVRIGRFFADGGTAATLRLISGAVRIDAHAPAERVYVIAAENLEARITGNTTLRSDAASARLTCLRGTAAITARDGQTYELGEHQSITQTWDVQGTMEMHLDPIQ